MLLTCSMEPAHTSSDKRNKLDNIGQLYPSLHTGKHTTPGVSSHLAKSSIGVTGVAFFLANSSAERNNRNKAKHCINDCRRPPTMLAPCWRDRGHDPKICPRHNAGELAEFKLEHIQKMLRWHRVTQLYRYQWSRYGTEGDFSINPRPHPCCA